MLVNRFTRLLGLGWLGCVLAVSGICAQGSENLISLRGNASTSTVIGNTAASMEPGSWVELPTIGYNSELMGGNNILSYSDRAVWDPRSQQVLFIGQDHLRPPPRFITYSAINNSWKVMETPGWAESLMWFHAYENNAIDVDKSILYHHPSNSLVVHRYDIAKGKWTTLPEISAANHGHGTALVYFQELESLVRVFGGNVYLYDEKKDSWWRLANQLVMGPYHNIAIYSPQHRAVIFGGGNGSNDLYRLEADRRITILDKAPINLGIGYSIVTLDPVSGEILILTRDNQFYAFNPSADKWRELKTENLPFEIKEAIHHVIATPISNYGVTFFMTSQGRKPKVYLYKHASKRAK